MFADIGLFEEERQKFFQELREINSTNVENPKVRIREANVKFRDNIRKYLPTCLNIINTCYKCQFSIYKVGNDFDSNFRVIQTNVRKTRGEIEIEFTNYENSVDLSGLSQSDREKLEKAKEILITYVDDPTDPNANVSEKLRDVTPVASSIITTTPVMVQKMTEIAEPENNKINYNPYANMEVNFEEEQEPVVDNSNSLNIFSIKENETLPTNDNQNNVGSFFNQSVFNNDNNVSVQNNIVENTGNKFIMFSGTDADTDSTYQAPTMQNSQMPGTGFNQYQAPVMQEYQTSTMQTQFMQPQYQEEENDVQTILSNVQAMQNTNRFIDTTTDRPTSVLDNTSYGNFSTDVMNEVTNNVPGNSGMNLGSYQDLNIDNSKNLNDLLSPMSEE